MVTGGSGRARGLRAIGLPGQPVGQGEVERHHGLGRDAAGRFSWWPVVVLLAIVGLVAGLLVEVREQCGDHHPVRSQRLRGGQL